RLKSQYQQKLIKSGVNIPTTNVFAEYGQINSPYNDVRLGISQSISFPTVYKRQKKLINEVWESSVLKLHVQEAQLRKQVAQVFYTLVYLLNNKELLENTDSILEEFPNEASLRFNTGETNILEKATAEHQRGQISLQLLQLQQDMKL